VPQAENPLNMKKLIADSIVQARRWVFVTLDKLNKYTTTSQTGGDSIYI
jgi:hypothetical protein